MVSRGKRGTGMNLGVWFPGGWAIGTIDLNMVRDLCKPPPFAQLLCQAQILSFEILNVFLQLKISPSLYLNKIEHFSKVSVRVQGLSAIHQNGIWVGIMKFRSFVNFFFVSLSHADCSLQREKQRSLLLRFSGDHTCFSADPCENLFSLQHKHQALF